MKKLGLLVAGLITVFSMAFAQGNYFGVFSGFPEAIGVQYTMNNNLRLSVGLPVFGGFGVAGSVDMIMARSPFNMRMNMDMSWYYGAGASAYFTNYYFWGSAFGANGHGLLGVEWALPNSNLGLFSEAQLGIGFDSVLGLSPIFGGRVGVNFH